MAAAAAGGTNRQGGRRSTTRCTQQAEKGSPKKAEQVRGSKSKAMRAMLAKKESAGLGEGERVGERRKCWENLRGK